MGRARNNDDEDDAPRRRNRAGSRSRAGKRRSAGGNGQMFAWIGGGVLLAAALAIALYFALRDKKKVDVVKGPETPVSPSKSSDPKGGVDPRNPFNLKKPSTPEPSALDERLVKYLPENAVRLEVLDIDSARPDPYLTALARTFMLELGLNGMTYLGLTADKIHSLVVAKVGANEGPSFPSYLFVRTMSPIDRNQFLQTNRAKELSFAGKTYYKFQPDPAFAPHGCFLEADLLLLSNSEKVVEKHLSQNPKARVSAALLEAIQLCRGPLAQASIAQPEISMLAQKANAFQVYSREGSVGTPLSKGKSFSRWMVGTSSGVHVYLAGVFADEKAAGIAQSEAIAEIETIRTGYAKDRDVIVPQLRSDVAQMMANVSCSRNGRILTIDWPFGTTLATWGTPKN